MSPDEIPYIKTSIVAQAREVWNRLAKFWDAQLGNGNDFQQKLIMPATDRLLNLQPGEAVLDLACGNGNYARRLADRGADVLACDFSAEFIELAKARDRLSQKNPDLPPIEYRCIDATDLSQLLSLGVQQFDAAVCSMAMMDMPTIQPMLTGLSRLLKPTGRFVFSLPHPCFNSLGSRPIAELAQEAGVPRQIYGVATHNYRSETAGLSSGLLNQPEPHPFFHRPLSAIFQACFTANFVIDGFEEPAFEAGSTGGKNAFSWQKRPEIPPAVVIRARLNHASE